MTRAAPKKRATRAAKAPPSSAPPAEARRPRIVVVVKKTTFQRFYVEERDPLVRRLVSADDPAVRLLRRSSEAHEGTLAEIHRAVERLGLEATYVPGSDAAVPKGVDLVVTVGGDGTLLAASHAVGAGVPVLGVNSAPKSSVGFFCAAKKGDVEKALEAALAGRLRSVVLARMRVDLNDRCLGTRVLNEALVCHASPAVTSRYILRVVRPDGRHAEEDQRSSGLWIGPAAGSTAAQRSAGGRVLPLGSMALQYVVREPYVPLGRTFHLLVGQIEEGGSVVVRSKMREAKIFLDGSRRGVDMTLGDVLTLSLSHEPLTVLGLRRRAT